MTVTIVSAWAGDALEHVRELMNAYAQLPHIAGRWERYAQEITSLPGRYVPPGGALLLALLNDQPAGCVALAAYEVPAICEMKRLYVVPHTRGQGVGTALVQAVLQSAASAGYTTMRLDTTPDLVAAQSLYHRSGFHMIPAYRADMLPDALCFERSVPVFGEPLR